MQRTFLITGEVLHERWQIRQPPSVLTTVIGWRSTPELEIDAGPAEETALIMTRAFTSRAVVTFPLSDASSPNPADMVRVLKEANPLLKVRDRFERIPSTVYLVSTRDPKSGALLFEDGRFSWCMQTAFALLSSPEAGPPELTRRDVLDFSGRQTIDFGAQLGRVVGAVFPGVDGNMAALTCRDHAFQTALVEALEREALASGYDWRVCSATGFRDGMADGRGLARSAQQ